MRSDGFDRLFRWRVGPTSLVGPTRQRGRLFHSSSSWPSLALLPLWKRPPQPVTWSSSAVSYGGHEQMVGTNPVVVEKIRKMLRPHPTMNAVIERSLIGTAGNPLDRPRHFILKPQGRLRTFPRIPPASRLVFSQCQPVE